MSKSPGFVSLDSQPRPTWLKADDDCRSEGVAVPRPPDSSSRKGRSMLCATFASSLPVPVSLPPSLPPTAMAAVVAAPGPGAPLPPDELLPKGDAEKTEEELEEDDDDEVLGPSGARRERGSEQERPARGCGLRVLRDQGIGASWGLERSERRRVLRRRS